MKRFYLMGDILVPSVVVVEAETLVEAIEKAEDDCDFEVYDKHDKSALGFRWNGDEDSVEVESGEVEA